MTVTRLRLREHQTTRRVALDPDDVDALLRAKCGIACAPSAGARGCYDLTPSSWVGVARAGRLEIEIRPKVAIGRLMALLAWSIEAVALREEDVEIEPDADLGEAMAWMLCRTVRRAARRGVMQGYRVTEEASSGVRGRIRFGEQVGRRFGIAPPVEVRYDEFTEDIEPNRLLRAAVAKLRRLPFRSPRTARNLAEVDRLFERVAVVEYAARDVPTIPYSRLNDHWRPAVELARWILRSAGGEAEFGAVTAPSILVDMNRVFEDFVVRSVRASLGVTAESFPQGLRGRRLSLDVGGDIGLEPDFSWWIDDRCVAIGDVKYKRLRGAGVVHPDQYQLLAYATAAGLEDALVVYAAGEDRPITRVVRHAGKRIHVRELDLSGSAEELMAQVAALGVFLRALASRGRGSAVAAGVATRA